MQSSSKINPVFFGSFRVYILYKITKEEKQVMVKNVFKGKWNQLKGTIKETWGKLDDDVIMEIDGNYDVLIGKLQELYGVTKEEAESEVAEFLKKA